MTKRLPRTAKGKRPGYFEDPATDRLMRMVLVLAEELSVTRERLDALERLLQEQGLPGPATIDAYVPDETAAAVREASRQAFIERLLSVNRAPEDPDADPWSSLD